METRMEKFSQLRDTIKKEISLDQEINQENKVVNSYMQKLNVIDSSFFSNVRTEFEQDFSWEKVYLDKNPDEQPYTSDFKYDLQHVLEQVTQAAKLTQQENKKNDQDIGDVMHNILISETLLNKPMYQKYQSILEKILSGKITYHNAVEKVEKKNIGFKINSSNIEFGTIAQMRKNDSRSTGEMLKESSMLVEDKHNNILIAYRKVKPRYKLLFVAICVVTLISVVSLVLSLVL